MSGEADARRPRTSRAPRALLVAAAVLCIGFFVQQVFFSGTRVTTIPLASATSSASAALSVSPGTTLRFEIHTARYSHSDGGNLMLDVQLHQGERTVGSMSCEAFDLSGSGGGCGVTESSSDCSITMPAGGADSIRAATRLQDPSGSATFEGLEVRVMR